METDAGRATRHKQPFAPIELAVEPTKETVFRRAFDAHVVRAFIGPTTTDWMQQHKRWWTRTAEKMENRGATRTIRRRLSKPEAQDSLNELFVRSHDSDVSDAVASDWSMDSSDSESACSEMEGSEVHSVHVTVASPEIEQSVTSPEIEQSVMSPEIEPQAMNEPTTIPMPELPSSPRDQPLKTAPTSTHERPHTARRRSSLQTLKGLFRRHSTSSKLRRSSDAAVEGRRSLDTVPSVSSTDEQPDRGRALSLSHGNNGSVRSPSQLAPRSSLDAGATSPKLSSLRRIAVTRNSLSASWQSQAEPAKPEPAKPEPAKPEPAKPEPAKPEPDKQDTVLPPALNPADMHVQLASLSTSDTTQSRINKSRRAMVAKVRAYYSRHAHISETTVLLSTRAVVRRETAAAEAFTDKYNEVTCMQYRQSSQEWAEMWLALTKRGIMFYLASKKRPTVAVQFPPYAAVAPRVSLFSTLDLSLAIMYPSHAASTDIRTEDPDAKSSLRVVVIKFPSAQVARTWYREIGQALLLGRVAYPGAFLNETQPAALPAPSSVAVHVPELGIKVQVQLGRHSLEVPPSVLLGGSDDAVLERQWRREATTVWHVRRDAVNALLRDPVASAQTQEWIDREQRGELTLGMAWRRHDRLDWIIPCGALDAHGCFRVATVSDSVVGPQLLERTHALELRVLEHYPDSVAVDNTQMAEPVGMEGLVMLKHEKRIVSYRPALLTTHNGLVFVVSVPRAARHMEAHTQQCTLSHAESSALDAPAVRYYHPDAQNCSKQMSLARYMLNITDVEQIEPIQPDDTHKHAGLRSKRARQALCKFRMVTRTGASVVVWTSSTLCMREWVDRLTNLRLYWTHRLMADHALHSQTCMLNYPGQGRSSRVRDDADWFDEGMWAERQIWHACLILGCRTIIKSGILYRKRRHHQGMRKVFCILTHSRLIEFSYPVAPLAPGQSMLAEHMLRNEPTMAHVFRNILSEPVSQTSASILFSKSRSLSLHRCYVVSRFTDDLSERDIMCEPWVMTDIGNYTGLRLADRVYADGVVSHELITDCIFTVWRPTFVPMILRSSAAEINPASDDCVSAEPPRMPASPRMPSVPDCPSISPHRGSLDYRSSADGYNSSISTSSVSSSPAHDTKPGAHRVGDEIRLSIDKKDGSKHNAMRSSMRHRVGVYKARTNSEMAQWVTAINQEIRRMSLHGEW